MSKPLELHVYPTIESERHEWRIEGRGAVVNTRFSGYKTPAGDISPTLARLLAERKHLTDSELAAEVWAPFFITNPSGDLTDFDSINRESLRRMRIVHRFATTPHYWEVPE